MLVYLLIALSLLSPSVFAFGKKGKPVMALLLIGTGAALSIYTALKVIISGGRMILIGNYDLVFTSTNITIDPLSAVFIIIISVAAVAVTIYSRGYLAGYLRKKPPMHLSLHYMSLVLLYFSMIFVVICRDAFGFLFAWELMTISSFMLILFDAQKREVRRAALNYLIQMHIGFVFLLVGFVLITRDPLSGSFDSLAVYFQNHNPLPVFVVFLVGFGMKAGLFPVHGWLPEAHPAAPSHISAFMSGVMIKMGVYGIMRVLYYVETGFFDIGIILFVAGAVTGLWGVILAAIQNEIKKMLAYSSIENIGIIFLALGAAEIGRSVGNDFFAVCAMSGALLHTVNHSLFKTLLFFEAGNVYTSAHTTSLDSLGGLSKKMPVTAGLFLLGVGAICALPPLNGFVSEFLIYYGLLDGVATGAGGIIIAVCGIVIISLIGGVVLLAFTKLFGVVFLGEARSGHSDQAAEVDKYRIIACCIPAAGIIMIGLLPYLFTSQVFTISGEILGIDGAVVYSGELGAQMKGVALGSFLLIVIAAGLMFLRKYLLKRQVVSRSQTWGCGFTAPSSRMQYSGESFSEGLYGISTSITNDSVGGDMVDKNEIFPTRHSFMVWHKDRVSNYLAKGWNRLIQAINVRVMRLNTGRVNHYVAYSLIFLFVIFVLSVLNII